MRDDGARAYLGTDAVNNPEALVTAILLGVVGFLSSIPTVEANDRLLARGQALAERRCSPCHAIGRHDPRPHDIVLPFRDFHERYPISMLVDARDTGVISGHDEMPGFDLSQRQSEIHALLAYIDSFAPSSKRYVKR
jgi:mono/diheme cytochrome c family protein